MGRILIALIPLSFSLLSSTGDVIYSRDRDAGGVNVFGNPRADTRFLLQSEASKLRLGDATANDMNFRFRMEQVPAINSPLPFDQSGVLFRGSALHYDQAVPAGTWLYVIQEITNGEDFDRLEHYGFSFLDSSGTVVYVGGQLVGSLPRNDTRFLLESEMSTVLITSATANDMNFRFRMEQVPAINSPLPFDQSGFMFARNDLTFDQAITSGTEVTVILEDVDMTGN